MGLGTNDLSQSTLLFCASVCKEWRAGGKKGIAKTETALRKTLAYLPEAYG